MYMTASILLLYTLVRWHNSWHGLLLPKYIYIIILIVTRTAHSVVQIGSTILHQSTRINTGNDKGYSCAFGDGPPWHTATYTYTHRHQLVATLAPPYCVLVPIIMITICAHSDTICLRPGLQVDDISIFIRQVAPVLACWPFKTSATSWHLTFWPWKWCPESRVMWATSVPILVFLGLSVLKVGPVYATDIRQTSDKSIA